MGAPAIFSGNFAKFLKSNLNLFDAAYVLTGTTNPTTTATLAPAGSLYLYTVAGSAAIYFKMDAGTTTNWVLFADSRGVTGLEYEMLIDDWASQSPYNLWTPNIIAQAGNSLIGSLTGTAALNTTDDTITFGTIGDSFTSTQQLDSAEFLANPNSILSDLGAGVDLLVYWKQGAVDATATYQLSRDFGLNYTTVTMSNAGSTTNAYYGNLTSWTEGASLNLATVATTNGNTVLNASTTQQIAQSFTIPAGAAWRIEQVQIALGAFTGTPVGNLFLKVVKDSSGTPSTVASDVQATSSAFAVSGLTASTTNNFNIPGTALPAGTYWVVVYSDATYTAAAGSNNIQFLTQTGGNNDFATFNGTTWAASAKDLKWSLVGRNLGLQVKITAGTANTKVAATAVAYSLQTGIVGSTLKRQVFQFTSTTNTNTFALTQFIPDPNLLTVYQQETGLTYTCGPGSPMTLQGSSIVFPANFFNPDSIARTVTLVATQNTGGSFNTSDQNSLLLAANHLGSTDPTIDKSSAGLGPIIRRPDGTLRMIALDNSDNLTISSVP